MGMSTLAMKEKSCHMLRAGNYFLLSHSEGYTFKNKLVREDQIELEFD